VVGDLEPVAVAREVLVVTGADLPNGRGVLESDVDLLVTANGPRGHPLTMPPLAVMVRPRFSLRYNLANPPHPIAQARRVRIFLS